MSPLSRGFVVSAAVMAAGIGGFAAGRPDLWPSSLTRTSAAMPAATQSPGRVIYYQDPDGKPAYSATPAKTPDGRAYAPVLESAEVRFEDPEPPPSVGAQPGRKIKYYRNPMGLPDTSPVPKKDSMGMDYLPVYEGEDSDDGSVKISPVRIQKTGVRSEPVERGPLGMPLRAPGTIQLDERRVSVVALRFEGFIESVANVTTGSLVRKGQPLMTVYGPSLSSAAAEYLSALRSAAGGELGSQAMRGARRRLDNLGMPEGVIETIEKTRDLPIAVTWPAPQDGVVLERAAVDGMRAAPGDVMFRIADTSVVWALIDIAEQDLVRVRLGQSVTLTPRGMPGRTFTGKVSLIYPQINKETRTGRVRIELDNHDGVLLPAMYVDATIATGSDAPVLTVPDSAVIDSGERQVVLLDKGDGRFEPRPVKLGRRGAGRTESRSGVSEGDKVVVSANFLIDAESNLKAALQGLTVPGDTE
jgi:Cu(I)/Ag(I) efflux system membrane fusion protein